MTLVILVSAIGPRRTFTHVRCRKSTSSLLHSVKCPHRNRHLHISQLPDHIKIVQMAQKYRSFSLCSSATRCNTSESGQTKQRRAVLEVGEKRNVYLTHRERKFQYLVYTDSRVVIAITDLRSMQEYRAKKLLWTNLHNTTLLAIHRVLSPLLQFCF